MSSRFRGGHRTVAILTLCQALTMTGNNILATTASLVGYALLVDKSWATLPTAVQMTGTMLAIIPASLLMAKLGRRAGFTIGAMTGGIGAALAMLAIFKSSFPLFCLGTCMLGAYTGFSSYYRFAAAEVAAPEFRGKAISLVLAGGVAAALFGPEMAKWSRNLFEPVLFAGCYAGILVLAIVAVILLQFARIPGVAVATDGTARPLRAIIAQPAFILAALAGMIAYGTMSLLMTATPLAMLACQHDFVDAAFVIQGHAIGMFAPGFFTGHLIDRFGAPRIMLCGILLYALCGIVALSGVAVTEFAVALFLLGVGWNCLFVGSTALLTKTYRPSERAKAQAANDFMIFGTVTVSSFSSGLLLDRAGWSTLATLVLPLAAIVLGLLIFHQRRARLVTAAATAG